MMTSQNTKTMTENNSPRVYSRTQIHERCEPLQHIEGSHLIPCTEIDMTIDSGLATTYNMLDWFKSFLIATGHAEESFYEACYKITEQHEIKQLQEKGVKVSNRHKLGETGIDSENFTLSVEEDAQKD